MVEQRLTGDYQAVDRALEAVLLRGPHGGTNMEAGIKVALRELNQAYASISTARDARLAAADTVRALRAQVELGEELTPAFIDFRIRREETMTRNEIREVLALVEYNVAITAFYRSLGTLLARNGIEFTKP